ncbi:hypothetical protein [Cupriavidus sp. 2SB]|uniref:hypothetical protein n=1 Tax=Cupriavidus sp. 2SB TaxID=2502199 RepID=UPI0010FA4EB7|nr:hypothetical protein [Cupriavidus sp. 2SB]
MRDELMSDALCWELETQVTAEYADAAKVSEGFAFYCPHEVCLAKVHTATKKNTYFVAPDRHVRGCPNEARSTEASSQLGAPRIRSAQVRDVPVPNLLGQPPKLKPKPRAPTREELKQLASAVRGRPVLHPGTLEEVVDAWIRLAPEERHLRPLTIGTHTLTYATAFTFVRDLPRPCEVATLNLDARIVFGAVKVWPFKHMILIESWKKFLAETAATEVPLRLTLNQNETPEHIASFVGKGTTLFWHGVKPELSQNGSSLRFKVDFSSVYTGIVLRFDE